MKCNTCGIVKNVLSVVFMVIMAAAILDAYYAHGTISNPRFGTDEASFSILAVVITLMMWTKNLDCSKDASKKYQSWVIFTILIIATAASIANVYTSHVGTNGIVVGSRTGSIAIVSFVITTIYWAKQVEKICSKCILQSKASEGEVRI